MGINIIEADGKRDLDFMVNRADAGDVFPGSNSIYFLDKNHVEGISAALCNIVKTANKITLDIFVSRNTCSTLAVISQADESQITIEGVLKNAGKNYFTDRKIVLQRNDNQGEEIIVLPRLPITAASGVAGNAPSVLSDFLEKEVILKGRIEKKLVKGVGPTDVLIVEEAQLK